jgi:hypothetical protein
MALLHAAARTSFGESLIRPLRTPPKVRTAAR